MIHTILVEASTLKLAHRSSRIFYHCMRQHHQERPNEGVFSNSGCRISWQNQGVLPSNRTASVAFLSSQKKQFVRMPFCTQPPESEPKQTSHTRDSSIKRYFSGVLGMVLLSAIGYHYYSNEKRKVPDVEEVRLQEYNFGQKPWLYRYKGYILSKTFIDKLKPIEVFDVREDDVWVVTFPKSGTTWLQEIVYLIMNDFDTDTASKTSINLRFPYFEYPTPGLQVVADMPSPRLIKSHLPLSLLPEQIMYKKPKIIYLARNPKDVVVSYYTFAIKFLNLVPFNGNFEDFCRLFATDRATYSPWWRHVSEAWKRKDDDNVLVLFYEDLLKDTHKYVKEIAVFLGKNLTDEQVAKIVKHCSFENMRHNNSVNYKWMQDAGQANKDIQFMRKGKVGDWKNHLSVDIIKQLDEMVATKLPPDMVGNIKDSLPEE